MRPHPFRTRAASAIVAVTLLCGACTGRAGDGATASPDISPTASPVAEAPSPAMTSDPAATPSPSPIETSVTPGPDVSSSPPVSSPAGSPMAEPPAGRLSVDGGDPVVGELGSFSWNNAGSDAPWLPGYPIHVGSTERLTFALARHVPIETWQVARVVPSSVPGGDGAVGIADGTGDTIGFDAPPPGRWSVSVQVRFGGNRGDAAYYWAVTVD